VGDKRKPQAGTHLRRRITANERELNTNVYELYGLNGDDVQLLQGQNNVEVLLEANLELAASAAK
jgi:hypothetical protein